MTLFHVKHYPLFAPDGAAGGAAAGGDGGQGGAGGGGPTPAAGGFHASLPESLRAHDAFKDVKDVGDLATRYVGAVTPKPFAEQLPKEIAGEAYFKDIKDVGSLATKAFHQAKMIGRDPNTLIVVPGDGADEKAWDDVYARLGRPAKAEDYKIAPPQGKEWTDDARSLHAAVQPVAHKLGLNQRQLQGLSDVLVAHGLKVNADRQAADTAAAEKTATALKQEWGAAYDTRLTRANLALTHFATEAKVDLAELNGELDRGKLGNRPALARLLDHLGAQLEEDGLIGRARPGNGDVASPNEAKQQLAALMEDKDFLAAWRTKSHPKHQEMVERRARLFELAYPPAV